MEYSGKEERERKSIKLGKRKRKDPATFYCLTSQPIETEILALDIVLGGGYEKGDMIELASPSGVGKSTTLLNVVANLLLKQKKRCLYVDVERALKDSIMKNMGIWELASGKIGDQFPVLAPLTFSDVDDVLEAAFACENPYDAIIIDSLKAIQPSQYVLGEKDVEDNSTGLESRIMGKFLGKFKAWARETGTTIWTINQMRNKIDFRFGAKLDAAGGNAVQHYPDIRLRMKAGEPLSREETTVNGVEKVVYGNMAKIWAVKNRAERPNIQVPLPVLYGMGVANVLTIREIMNSHGLIDHKGGGRYIVTVGDKEHSLTGSNGVNQFIRASYHDLKDWLKESGHLRLTQGPTEDYEDDEYEVGGSANESESYEDTSDFGE